MIEIYIEVVKDDYFLSEKEFGENCISSFNEFMINISILLRLSIYCFLFFLYFSKFIFGKKIVFYLITRIPLIKSFHELLLSITVLIYYDVNKRAL